MKLEDRKCHIVMYTLVHTVGTKKNLLNEWKKMKFKCIIQDTVSFEA